MKPGKRFDPRTETSRRPTPERFAFLRKYIDPSAQSIEILTLDDLKDINGQLEKMSKQFVSSIMQRVLAHMYAATDGGFVSLRADLDGALHVTKTGITTTVLQAAVSFAAAANNEVIAAVTGKRICIVNLALTIADEVNLTLRSGTTGLSGAMDFGGEQEPRGIVHHFGDFPLKTAEGEAFNILASAAVQVSGYVTYYTE